MKLTVKAIREKKKKEKIVCLTAYDFPFARILDEVGMDIILVGDSLGMVLLGYDSTVRVTLREMVHHTKAVSRAVKRALIVSDMPFASYQGSFDQAFRSAKRLIQEGGAEAVKLEGAGALVKTIKGLIQAGIPVMGHLGMTPQTATFLGGYKVQGREPKAARQILEDAQKLEDAGVFSLVLECVPRKLAEQITKKISCPTIGIGAGPKTDGQILVLHDLLGFEGPVHPRFVRRYASFEKEAKQAFSRYLSDVRSGSFPSLKESFE
ncbi:MAG: 3-methyl-2-oxobutanoate hydroxymethyltransferase [Candidatus Omnitrophica bacterium]|nr:3-methyl-2-oxobutanoate hydroxymethyltransferase [Candidatus Omnitrophota bacterium]